MPTIFNGYTIITGMFGLDGEHGMKAEFHPLFAFSTRRDSFENSASDEVWLMFVRNQGDEGFCSSQIWDAGFEDYTVKLPWRSGFQTVDVNWDKTNFEGTDGTSGPFVKVLAFPAKDAGVYVSFHVGPAVYGESRPLINGALHLVWGGSVSKPPTPGTGVQNLHAADHVTAVTGVVGRTATTGVATAGTVMTGGTTRTPPEPADEVEDALQNAIAQLPHAKGDQVMKARLVPGVQAPVMHPLAQARTVERITSAPSVAAVRIAKPHAIKAGPAAQKNARDAAQVKALCDASNNSPTGLGTDACKTNTQSHQ